MDIYLPIAEMSVNLLLIAGLGGLVGFMSGLFGVGGGFLMTPLLIFVGIPPAVAVGTSAAQVVASSVSGTLAQFRRGNVDVRMGTVLVVGGFMSAAVGVWIFALLRRLGQIELVVSLSYVLLLGIVGGLMLAESIQTFARARRKTARRGKLHHHSWLHGLPFKMRFQRSRLYISALLPLGLGIAVGILSAIMGVGGGFVMVPAMIYLLGMPTSLVVGTSLFQITFVAGLTTLLHGIQNQTVDIVLAVLLIAGGVIGAQFGSRFGARLKGEQIRILLAVIVLAVCGKLALDLFMQPDDPYSLAPSALD